MEPVQDQLEPRFPRPVALGGRAAPIQARRTRPGALSWEREMHHLEWIHERELRLPSEAVEAAASRLGVTARSVSGRFGEHARHVGRAWDGALDAAAVTATATMPGFREAAESLRATGFDGPSIVIERLLMAAPGPAARALRAREANRRLAQSASTLATAA